MDAVPGKREAHKQATRVALQIAAEQLFAERGFAATTVRDIADAAGVNERTFFRYFPSKQALLLDDVLGWATVLQQAVRERPSDEPPLIAVFRALQSLYAGIGSGSDASPVWLFADGPPVEKLGIGMRDFVLAIERGLTDVFEDRLTRSAPHTDQLTRRFEAEVNARLVLALLRSVLLFDAQRSGECPGERTSREELVELAFAQAGVRPN